MDNSAMWGVYLVTVSVNFTSVQDAFCEYVCDEIQKIQITITHAKVSQ